MVPLGLDIEGGEWLLLVGRSTAVGGLFARDFFLVRIRERCSCFDTCLEDLLRRLGVLGVNFGI